MSQEFICMHNMHAYIASTVQASHIWAVWDPRVSICHKSECLVIWTKGSHTTYTVTQDFSNCKDPSYT